MNLLRKSSFLIVFINLFLASNVINAAIDIEYSKDSPYLNSQQLIALVKNNSIVGQTQGSDSLYELYFDGNGDFYFIKNHDIKNQCKGKWWVKDDYIYSSFYQKERHIHRVDKMHYYHIVDNVYYPEAGKDGFGNYKYKQRFSWSNKRGRPFFVVKGKLPIFTYKSCTR